MGTTGYAAVWQDGGRAIAGRILVGPRGLNLEGASRGRKASRHIAYAEIAGSSLGRGSAERIGGRPLLVLELRDGETIRIATTEFGTLHELIEAVMARANALRSEPQRNVPLVNDRTVLG